MGVRLRLAAAASLLPPDKGLGGDPPPHPTLTVPPGDYIVEDNATAHNLSNAFKANNFTAEVLPLLDQHANLPQLHMHITAAVYQDLIRDISNPLGLIPVIGTPSYS